MADDDDPARLDEYDADEWFDIGRAIKPSYTRAEFDKDWAEFQAIKREHGRQRQH